MGRDFGHRLLKFYCKNFYRRTDREKDKMIEVFLATLNQIVFLVLLIVVGFCLTKAGALKDEASGILAKLETYIFVPAVVMQSAMENFTIHKIKSAGILFALGFVITLVIIPFAIILAKGFTKDNYMQNIYKYSFTFANYGYMGNAVVLALFPDYFFEYIMFTLPLSILIFAWIVPVWLLADTGASLTAKDKLKNIINPMFVGLIIGMIIGLIKMPIPVWLSSTVSASANCMSPIAMLLTGIAVASMDLRKAFTNGKIYAVCFIRLIAIPLIFIGILYLVKPTDNIIICVMCAFAMPLGMNPIIFPKAYGKDTSVAAGMTVVSHLLSAITIPIVFAIVKSILL